MRICWKEGKLVQTCSLLLLFPFHISFDFLASFAFLSNQYEKWIERFWLYEFWGNRSDWMNHCIIIRLIYVNELKCFISTWIVCYELFMIVFYLLSLVVIWSAYFGLFSFVLGYSIKFDETAFSKAGFKTKIYWFNGRSHRSRNMIKNLIHHTAHVTFPSEFLFLLISEKKQTIIMSLKFLYVYEWHCRAWILESPIV